MSKATVRQTPEDEHLADQERLLAELTAQLATKEAEFATVGAALARFRISYLSRFAPLYAELDRLEAETARLVADRTPPEAPEAEEAESRAEEAEARAEESESAAEGADEDPVLPPEPSADLKALYRTVAKAVHPDLAEDDEDRERRTRIMAAASQAYRDGEALLGRYGGDDFYVRSAGTEQTRVNPYAVRALAEIGVDWAGARSKVLTEFVDQPWDYVITVCDRARQACPVFPGAVNSLHWGLDDPSEVEGTDEEKMAAFRRTATEVSVRLHPFVEIALRTAGGPRGR